MATHDYVIDNSTGANVRADINNALLAIVSNNSNSSSPSTTYAYQWWADTSNNVLKIRNSANNAWIELLQLDGTLTLEDGSASTPALAFRDDLNTGIFSSEADSFNVATGGVERMKLGDITIFNESGANVDFRIESVSNSHMFFVDAGNNSIGIGTSSPSKTFVINENDSECVAIIKSSDTGTAGLFLGGQSDEIKGGILFNNSTNNLTLQGHNNSTVMTLDSSGRVMIGVTSTAHASTNADDLCVGNNDSSSQHGITIGSTVAGNLRFADSASGSAGILQYIHSADQFVFYTNGAIQRLSLQASGAAFSVPVQFGSSNSHDGARIVIQGTGNNSGTTSIFIKNSDETPLFHVRNDGVIFTGTDGASPYNHTTSSAANLQVSSTGALARSTSSVRYKKDIADATFGLADVLKLKPKTFKNNATGEFADDKTYAGFTAEDIHDLGLTEFVQYNEANEPDALDYGNMVALMAKAIQELNAKVAALEAA